jgi:hypothetical protein
MSSTTDLAWFKSSYSGTQGDSCVEVAVTGQAILVRDSKDTAIPHLTLTRTEWASFVRFAVEAV